MGRINKPETSFTIARFQKGILALAPPLHLVKSNREPRETWKVQSSGIDRNMSSV